MERKPPPRMFMFSSWLSTGIARVNKESCKTFCHPDLAPDCRQYVIDCSLGHAVHLLAALNTAGCVAVVMRSLLKSWVKP